MSLLRRDSRGQWHRVYYALAVFAILTVAGGLYLTRRMASLFHESVLTNQEWVRRQVEYARLGDLASALNAPANDVFQSNDPDREERRLAEALPAFDEEIRRAGDEIQRSLEGETRGMLLADLAALDEKGRAMVADGQQVLRLYREGQPAAAARRMAIMDNRYAALNLALTRLRGDARRSQATLLVREEEVAQRLRFYQIPLAIVIVVMVGVATLYGHNLTSQMHREQHDREELVRRLRESEASLERRVGDRTRDLAESRSRLAQAQTLARLGSWEWNIAANEVSWSDETYRLFGFEVGAVVPSYEAYVGMIHPDDRASVSETIARALATHESFEYDQRIVRADGAVRTMHSRGSVTCDAAGRPALMAGTTQDVTEQREIETARRVSEERFQLAARATNDALWDRDVRTGEMWWSERFRVVFGHATPEPSVEYWIGLLAPDDRSRITTSLAQFMASAEDTWTAEYRLRRGNGSQSWVLDRAVAVRDADGRPRRLVGSMLDITERKEAERMKSDFVSFVSHQLRTPLAGMNWMLELAADAGNLSDAAREYIQDARESAARLVGLVNDLLDIARLESGRVDAAPERVALDDLARSVLREFETLIAERGHHVQIRSDGTVSAWVDPQLIRQVMANLLSNAIKYTPPGGRIEVALQGRNGQVQVDVADSGLGVPHAAQSRLFERFFRAGNAVALEVEGTGLGLHLVRLIVEQAGGRVWCESEEGRGSVFSFTVPAAPEGKVS